MIVSLQNISKRFAQQEIIKDFSYTFEESKIYAIYGHNGVGKSTLLQIIAGTISPNEGIVTYTQQNKNIAVEEIYQHICIATPYLELIEDYSMEELLDFHFSFKKVLSGESIDTIYKLLPYDRKKAIKNYSSGMKQRLKLVLALFTQSNMMLLDEPTANFDEEGIIWYKNLMQQYRKNRLTIIASAQKYDHDFCDELISLI
jgi:ABC-type multidrug transport system ATPase subunit